MSGNVKEFKQNPEKVSVLNVVYEKNKKQIAEKVTFSRRRNVCLLAWQDE